MRVIVSAVIRPSHCCRHTRTVGTGVPRNNAATSVATNYRRLSVVIRQPAVPAVATMAKATSARKITGEWRSTVRRHPVRNVIAILITTLWRRR